MKIDRTRFKNRLLFIDCETSLLELYAHCIGSNQHIGHYQVKKDKKIICICYMAEGWKTPKSLVWDSEQDDKELLDEFAEIAKEYDLIVAQNGDSFDIKVIRGRAWIQRATVLPQMLTLDTLKMSRANFRLTSHKLDYKSKVIGREGKIPTDFQLWVDVQNNDYSALKRMVKYCKGDVLELQEVFWSMLPYCQKLPHQLSVILYGDPNGCPRCCSKSLVRNGKRGMRQRWACRDCDYDWTDSRSAKTIEKLGIGAPSD